MIVLLILFAPFVGALLLFFQSNKNPTLVRVTAALSTFVSFVLSFYLLYAYDFGTGGFQYVVKYDWSRELGVSFFLGVDGISVPMVLASSILVFTGVFVSWHIKDRPKEFYIFLLILAGATIGVYTSLDLFFLYFFYELAVIPMYLLIGVWGTHTEGYLQMEDKEKRDSVGFILNFGQNSKEYAAMKLTLYLSVGAVVALLGILLIYAGTGLKTFNLFELSTKTGEFSRGVQSAIWLLLFFGFASIAPIWPLHSWSPVGHASAPSATSMLHAGVLMKLGHFSIFRTCYLLFPEATKFWMPLAAILCIFNIVYGGLVALFQKDTKYVIGYASSSHMGYVFLGMAALNVISMTGAVLYMFAHALGTGMLFAGAGYTYDQTHTRSIPRCGGLSKKMPFLASFFVVACAASFGLPLTVNFIGELMIFVGSWDVYPVQTVIAVVAIALTLAYLFRMLVGLFFGEMNPKWEQVQDASAPADSLPLIILMATSIFFGVFPSQFINVIRSGVIPLLEKIHGVTSLFSPTGGRFF